MELRPLLYPISDETTRFQLARFIVEAFGARTRFKYPTRWNWSYRPGAVSLIVADAHRIVGHLGCTPFVAQNGGRRVAGAWSVDLHVLRPYRGRGWGRRLQSEAQTVNPLLMSFFFADITRRIKVSIGLESAATVWLLRRISTGLAALGRTDIRQPDPALIEKASIPYLSWWSFFVERTNDYCAWRFRDQPVAGYMQIQCDEGLVLIRRCGPVYRGDGMIGDAFPSSQSTTCLSKLVDVACETLFTLGCRAARFACTSAALRDSLIAKGWVTINVMDLYAQPGAVKGPVFLSLSDQDVDHYPS